MKLKNIFLLTAFCLLGACSKSGSSPDGAGPVDEGKQTIPEKSEQAKKLDEIRLKVQKLSDEVKAYEDCVAAGKEDCSPSK